MIQILLWNVVSSGHRNDDSTLFFTPTLYLLDLYCYHVIYIIHDRIQIIVHDEGKRTTEERFIGNTAMNRVGSNPIMKQYTAEKY